MPGKPKVIHIISGDRWAGAEVQAFTLIQALKPKAIVAAIILNEGELAQQLQQLGVQTWVLNENNLSALQLFRKICQILRSFKPDVVHTHRQKENILGSIANNLTVRARCVRTTHGAPEFPPSGIARLQVKIDLWCGKFLQYRVIAVSADLGEKLSKHYQQNKIVVIPNGVDPQEIRKNTDLPDFRENQTDHVHVGLVGRLDPVKRVDIFIEMAEQLTKEAPDTPWSFHIFGEGKQEQELKTLAANVTANITFHGHRMDIRTCINGLNILVMPSDHEGLPMTALEAIALNTPFICHNVGGLTKLFSHHPHHLVNEHTPKGYAEKVLSATKEKRAPCSFPKEYDISRTATETMKIYSQTNNTI